MSNGTVVEVTEVSVEPPLVDRARAFVIRLGTFLDVHRRTRVAAPPHQRRPMGRRSRRGSRDS
jgi:hypothetical protein